MVAARLPAAAAAALLLSVALPLTGCTPPATSGAAATTPAAGSAGPARPGSASTAAAPSRASTGTPRPAATLTVTRPPDAMTAWLALGEHVLAWAGCDRCGDGRENQLQVADRATGRVRTVARTSYPGGHLGWVGVDQDRLFWVDWQREQSLEDLGSNWRLRTCLLPGCQAMTIQTGAKDKTSPPYPTIAAGRLVVPLRPPWAVVAPGTTQVRIYDTATLEQTADQRINASADEVHLAGDRLVFESMTPYPARPVTRPTPPRHTDIYTLRLGAPPQDARALSRTGSDRLASASQTTVAWVHRDLPDGATGSIWAAALTAGQAPRKVNDTLSDGVWLADRWLVYVTSGAAELRALDLRTGKQLRPLAGPPDGAAWPAGVATHGNQVAFSTRNPDTLQETLHVTTLGTST